MWLAPASGIVPSPPDDPAGPSQQSWGVRRRWAPGDAILSAMPVISRFLGIAIAILYRDHDPPHFHAIYGEYKITVGIKDGVVTGRFPRRALAHVLEWAALHRDELLANWDRARAKEPLASIAPLE